jgi:hypothetical protein
MDFMEYTPEDCVMTPAERRANTRNIILTVVFLAVLFALVIALESGWL